MAKKKQIIEESFKKMKTLLESRLSEAPVAQPAVAPAAAPAAQPATQQAAPAPAQNQQQTVQKSQAVDAEMDKAMKFAVGNIDNLLAKFAATSGDKDGELDLPGQDKESPAQPTQGQSQPAQGQAQGQTGQQVMESEGGQYLKVNEGMLDEGLQQEAIGMLAGGIALSAPTITKWIGKGIGALGKKADSKSIKWVGDKMAKFGDKWHHAYIDTIAKGVAKLMPPNKEGVKPTYKDPKVHKIANVIFMSLVAAMGVGAATGAAHAAATGHSALATVEGGLAGVKGFESGSEILKGITPLLKSMGIG